MVDLYDRTTDLEEHLGVYKAQMYVQDVTTLHIVVISQLA